MIHATAPGIMTPVPRLVEASAPVVLACTAAGVLCAVGAAVCFFRAGGMGSAG